MLLAIDVLYVEDEARVAAVSFEGWDASAPISSWVTTVIEFGEYEPGQFYKRELPCITAILAEVDEVTRASMTTVIIDGYVWLGDGREGLGMHVYRALDERIAVVGVAKNEFAGNDVALPVLRGDSKRPLYVTAAGTPVEDAARHVADMHGPYRIPTMLQKVDALTRY